MKTQASRLQELVNKRGVPAREQKRNLAAITSVSYEGVRQWFAKDMNTISGAALDKIARVYHCRLEWLISGTGEMDAGDKYTNGRETRQSARKVPVLSCVEAGDPKQIVDAYLAGAGMSEISVDCELEQELSAESFALVISGRSMAPEYVEGDIVVVDPSVKPRPGDVVVGLLSTDNKATIKKYRSRGNDDDGHHFFELVPINPDYHTITVSSANPGHIIGTVVEHRRNLRRRR